MPHYRVTRTIERKNWCELEADDLESAEDRAIENDVWHGDDGSDENYDSDYEVEEI